MSSRKEIIKSVFEGLLQDSGKPGQRVRKRIDKSSPIKIHAACVFPQKYLTLEIGPIKNAWLPQGFRKPRIKGLSIALKALEQMPGSDVILLMELQQNESVDIFSVFVTRVCDELDGISKPSSAVKTIISLIDKWKEFFSGSSDILSEERQTGLYGELYLLHYLTLNGIDIGKLVSAWTGSKKTSQDYEFGSIAIEVKSSAAVDASRITISNSRQLDDVGIDKLFLARLLFDARQGETQTLPKLIETIREKIKKSSPETGIDFEEKLLGAGYQGKHYEQYFNRTYSERELIFFQIKNGFPRLLEKTLPKGITKVSYELIIDMCRDFIIENEKVIDVLRNRCD
jgi:hypothetical protein